MNIFVTSKCPVKSAEYLDNKRVNKMILESCQMLSTAINLAGGKGLYKSCHINHPCSVWVRESLENFLWLWAHMEALQDEYHKVSGKVHKSYRVFTESNILSQAMELLPSKGLTPFANCAANSEKGVSYKHIDDTVLAYKLYLNDRWDTDKLEPKWRN